MRPTAPPISSVNQRLPSGPAAMAVGWLVVGLGSANCRTCPPAVRRSIRPPLRSVTHTAPSGPAAAPKGPPLGLGSWQTASVPALVTCTTEPCAWSGIQAPPEASTATKAGLLAGRLQSVRCPDCVTRPTREPPVSLNQTSPLEVAARPVGWATPGSATCRGPAPDRPTSARATRTSAGVRQPLRGAGAAAGGLAPQPAAATTARQAMAARAGVRIVAPP